jgi:hypothetical protein
MIKNLGRRAALAGAVSAVGLLATTGAALASGIATTTEGTLIDLWGEYCRRSEQWARLIKVQGEADEAAIAEYPKGPLVIAGKNGDFTIEAKPPAYFEAQLQYDIDTWPTRAPGTEGARELLSEMWQPRIDAARARRKIMDAIDQRHGVREAEAAADEACNHTYDIVHAILAAEPKTLLDVQVKLMAVAHISGVFGLRGEFDPDKLEQHQRAIYDLIVNLQKLTGRVLPNEHDINDPILAGSA